MPGFGFKDVSTTQEEAKPLRAASRTLKARVAALGGAMSGAMTDLITGIAQGLAPAPALQPIPVRARRQPRR